MASPKRSSIASSKYPGYVYPRASSFYFKGKATRLSEVAHELGVANLLEGSVRRAGNR